VSADHENIRSCALTNRSPPMHAQAADRTFPLRCKHMPMTGCWASGLQVDLHQRTECVVYRQATRGVDFSLLHDIKFVSSSRLHGDGGDGGVVHHRVHADVPGRCCQHGGCALAEAHSKARSAGLRLFRRADRPHLGTTVVRKPYVTGTARTVNGPGSECRAHWDQD